MFPLPFGLRQCLCLAIPRYKKQYDQLLLEHHAPGAKALMSKDVRSQAKPAEVAAIKASEDISKIFRRFITAPDPKQKPYNKKFLEKTAAMRLIPLYKVPPTHRPHIHAHFLRTTGDAATARSQADHRQSAHSCPLAGDRTARDRQADRELVLRGQRQLLHRDAGLGAGGHHDDLDRLERWHVAVPGRRHHHRSGQPLPNRPICFPSKRRIWVLIAGGLAGVCITYVVYSLTIYARGYFGQANIAAKTLVDSRFLL